jgi:hypothetical protein
LKTINQNFNEHLDAVIKSLTEESQRSEESNKNRLEQLRKDLNYIENRNLEAVEQIIQEKCEPNFTRNNSNAQDLLKKVINYIEDADER